MARRITIVDVARAAETSVSSASVALRGEPGVSEETRRRVLATAERLGYRPDSRARMLRERQSRLLGVTCTVTQTFHAEVVEHLYRAVAETGYDLVLSATTRDRSEAAAVESLLQERCAALLLISPVIGEAELAAVGRRAPSVVIGSELTAVDSVRADDERGIALAVEHLVVQGHEDIHYVDGGGAVLSATRCAGYLAAMRDHGLEARTRVLAGAADEESGIAAAHRLLAGGALPTAVVAHNDMTAFGLLLALRGHGVSVPEQISVVGYDDTRLAALSTVGLTSVSQDPARLAEEAVRRAITRAEGGAADPQTFVTPPRLVIRTSTAPARS
jgi:DNA-binding LacI/PurR family transcriptional regulator